jgi:hypothetical protein
MVKLQITLTAPFEANPEHYNCGDHDTLRPCYVVDYKGDGTEVLSDQLPTAAQLASMLEKEFRMGLITLDEIIRTYTVKVEPV